MTKAVTPVCKPPAGMSAPDALLNSSGSAYPTMPVVELEAMGADYNPRVISDHDLESLRRSLRYFGLVEPVVVNQRTNRIVGGHQRVKAAAAEGIEDFPVVLVDLDEPSEKQLNVALNRISGQWDDAKLRALLQSLDADGAEMELTGFDDAELGSLLREAQGVERDAENVPDQVESRVQVGDIWRMGKHRLLCGDSGSLDSVNVLLEHGETERFSLCLTDPPYGLGAAKASGKNDYDLHEDSRESLELLAARWLPIARDLCDAVVFSPGVTNAWVYPEADWVMCWFYGGGQLLSSWGFNCWQPFLCYGKDPSLASGNGGRPDAVDLNVPANSGEIDHPCPKPVSLWQWFLERLCFSSESIVFEPFAGSGTTFIACEDKGVACMGIELSPHYCDVSLSRWEQFTGASAELLSRQDA